MRTSIAAASALTLASSAFGQSINIRFGAPETTPSPAYAGVGLAGTWNSFRVTGASARQPLVGLTNFPLNARYYQIGNSSMLESATPPAGDDERLVANMILSSNSPVDGCFWVEGLLNGPYEVTLYAITPNDPTLMSRTRVDFATQGPIMVGGAWAGQHAEGVTYSRFNVTTSNGVIGLHSGLYNGFIQSGLNGMQLKFLGTCGVPTVTAQPPSTLITDRSEIVSFAAAFTNPASAAGGLQFQWTIDRLDGAGPVPIGTSAVSQTLVHPGPSLSGIWTCRATNACGTTSAQSTRVSVLTADMGTQGGIPGTDGQFDNNDFVVFVNAFFGGHAKADLAGQGAVPGADGQHDNNDFVVFVNLFFGG